MPFISFDRVRYGPDGNSTVDGADLDIASKRSFF
jgi:hypothetical protein